MKKIIKKTCSIWTSHLAAILIILIIGLPLLSFVKSDLISTAIMSAIYLMLIYSAGWNAGMRDSRKVGESFPDVKGAVIAALLSCIIPVTLLILRVAAYHISPTVWRPYGEGFEMIQTTSPFIVIMDIIYRLYHYYCVAYLKSGSLLVYIIPILVPVIIYPLSYLVGLTRFSIMERYLPFLIYKPKQRKNKNQ